MIVGIAFGLLVIIFGAYLIFREGRKPSHEKYGRESEKIQRNTINEKHRVDAAKKHNMDKSRKRKQDARHRQEMKKIELKNIENEKWKKDTKMEGEYF